MTRGPSRVTITCFLRGHCHSKRGPYLNLFVVQCAYFSSSTAFQRTDKMCHVMLSKMMRDVVVTCTNTQQVGPP